MPGTMLDAEGTRVNKPPSVPALREHPVSWGGGGGADDTQ